MGRDDEVEQRRSGPVMCDGFLVFRDLVGRETLMGKVVRGLAHIPGGYASFPGLYRKDITTDALPGLRGLPERLELSGIYDFPAIKFFGSS